MQECWRIVFAEIGRETVGCHETDACADFLDAGHQRVRHQHRLEKTKAELTSDLRVGGDAARVVVRGPSDKTGARTSQPAVRRHLRRSPGDEGRFRSDSPRSCGACDADLGVDLGSMSSSSSSSFSLSSGSATRRDRIGCSLS